MRDGEQCMKRCYFIGLSSILDADLIDRLQEECEKVIAAEDQVEFWFSFSAADAYIGSCLCLATRLRTMYPKKVKIVRVFDPNRENARDNWYREAFSISFPRSLPDRSILSPDMNEGIERDPKQFMQQFNKMERWVLRQMDIIFAYYYPNLEDGLIYQVEYARRSCKAEVIHISFEETENFIQEKAETLFDERTTKILAMLKDNIPQKDIGKAVGVTTSRIGQIAHKAARDIRQEVLRRGVRIKREKDRKCGLCCLSSEATALQLVVFESLITYLSSTYQIEEFWIDEKSCNTAYGAVLAKFCVHSSATAKVVVCLDEDDPDAWEKCVDDYVPPFSSVVNLGLESHEWTDICEEMVRQCTCIITDFTAPDFPYVQELSEKASRKFLFDVSKKKYTIEEFREDE